MMICFFLFFCAFLVSGSNMVDFPEIPKNFDMITGNTLDPYVFISKDQYDSLKDNEKITCIEVSQEFQEKYIKSLIRFIKRTDPEPLSADLSILTCAPTCYCKVTGDRFKKYLTKLEKSSYDLGNFISLFRGKLIFYKDPNGDLMVTIPPVATPYINNVFLLFTLKPELFDETCDVWSHSVIENLYHFIPPPVGPADVSYNIVKIPVSVEKIIEYWFNVQDFAFLLNIAGEEIRRKIESTTSNSAILHFILVNVHYLSLKDVIAFNTNVSETYSYLFFGVNDLYLIANIIDLFNRIPPCKIDLLSKGWVDREEYIKMYYMARTIKAPFSLKDKDNFNVLLTVFQSYDDIVEQQGGYIDFTVEV